LSCDIMAVAIASQQSEEVNSVQKVYKERKNGSARC